MNIRKNLSYWKKHTNLNTIVIDLMNTLPEGINNKFMNIHKIKLPITFSWNMEHLSNKQKRIYFAMFLSIINGVTEFVGISLVIPFIQQWLIQRRFQSLHILMKSPITYQSLEMKI